MTSVGCVVLSQGDRPGPLSAALTSVLDQRDAAVEVLVVGNGWVPTGLPATVEALSLEDNAGVPEGRNIGAAAVPGDLLFFLDDDVKVVGADFLARVVDAFDDDPSLGVLQPRAVSADGSAGARRHVPRLRAGDPMRSGDVAWFWEGASVIRRSAFEAAGGWPGLFFYGHEGIELAWRLVDAGYRISYRGDLEVLNPPAEPFRGHGHRYLDARNRVWVARRNLPAALSAGYLTVWGAATLARTRSGDDLRDALNGFRDGFRQACGPRRRISWNTAWRLTRLGRPPIV
jgi:hypothetical protein